MTTIKHNILSTIKFDDGKIATLSISQNGIKITYQNKILKKKLILTIAEWDKISKKINEWVLNQKSITYGLKEEKQ